MLVGLAVVVGLVLGGCSSDSGGAATVDDTRTTAASAVTPTSTTSSSTTTSTTTAPTTAPPATTTPTTAGGGGAAPAPAPAPSPGLVAPQGYRSVTLVVTMPDGSTRQWCVWVADTPALRSRGLMDVTDPGLGGRAGMVFVFEGDTSSGFWMKDTLLPLSIAWYRGRRVVRVQRRHGPVPGVGDDCPSTKPAGPYRYAVEVPQGLLGQLGLVQGSTISRLGVLPAAPDRGAGSQAALGNRAPRPVGSHRSIEALPRAYGAPDPRRDRVQREVMLACGHTNS